MQYNLKLHRHRFAVWTAARAVQRSWTTTSKVSQVIHAVQLAEFADNFPSWKGQQAFDHQHNQICDRMIKEFRLLDIEASYGRAAKILAIYLKTTIVINSELDSDHLRLIHPPIDRILLKNLPGNANLEAVKKLDWTQLDKDGYWKLVNIIRERLGSFDWRLEIGWTPELD